MKVTFDGGNKLIRVNEGVTTLDVQADIYSKWKEWMVEGDNGKFLPAIRTIGGDPTVQDKVVAPYFFLMNGWKIKPYGWTHTLNLVGNLFVDEPEKYGDNIVVPPDGNYTVLVNLSTTSDASRLLVGSGVTQQDKQDIKDLIVNSSEIVDMKAKIGLIKKIQSNNIEVKNDKFIVYDDDGVTPMLTFNLSGELKKNYAKRVKA